MIHDRSIYSQRLPRLVIKLYSLWVKRKFKRLDSLLDPRVEIRNPQYISIGAGVHLRPYTWIYAIPGVSEKSDKFHPSIEIGDGSSIGRFCHITATNHVLLEPEILVAEGVFISDNFHGYQDIETPIIRQPMVSLGPVIIGRGTWIGNGAIITGKLRVGKNCVIGANAFVNKDVPDYCVVAGIPAVILKRYDPAAKQWISVHEPL